MGKSDVICFRRWTYNLENQLEFIQERSSIETESIDKAINGVLQGKKKGCTHNYHWLE